MIYEVGDIVKVKKQHPCGSNEWEIVRVGADYKIKCTKCGRIVMLSSEQLKKIVKSVSRVKNEE